MSFLLSLPPVAAAAVSEERMARGRRGRGRGRVSERRTRQKEDEAEGWGGICQAYSLITLLPFFNLPANPLERWYLYYTNPAACLLHVLLVVE